MKEYLFLFRGGDAESMNLTSEQGQAHREKWMAWMGALAEAGRFVGAQPLQQSGRQVLGPRKAVTDGPYLEGKEIVGGYLICKAESYDEAVSLAKGCPILEFADGLVEVRELQELKR